MEFKGVKLETVSVQENGIHWQNNEKIKGRQMLHIREFKIRVHKTDKHIGLARAKSMRITKKGKTRGTAEAWP